jgi:serpin B
MTRLVLAAAVFFYGKWERPFPISSTSPAPFRLTRTGETVEVPMMWQEGLYGYVDRGGFQALELPYIGNKISMVVLLPDAPDGWESLEKELTATGLARLFHALRDVWIIVKMPKFQLESSFTLNKALGAMGLQDAFSPSADFGGMSLEKPLGIGAMIHKATVEVDEAGTIAAAASGIEVYLGLPKQFLADHPFLFVIRDIPTDAILFMGRVLEPGGSGNAAIAAKPPRLFDSLLRALGLTRGARP